MNQHNMWIRETMTWHLLSNWLDVHPYEANKTYKAETACVRKLAIPDDDHHMVMLKIGEIPQDNMTCIDCAPLA